MNIPQAENNAKTREFQVFVKPAGSLCNMGCSYCYYLGKGFPVQGNDFSLMKDDILERFIIQMIEATTENEIMFSWHGGEPLLAGLDFYKKAVRIQKKHLPHGRSLINGIQTNGTLIDEKWSSFLAEENFVVGISIDGPPEVHDCHRMTRTGNPTHEKVTRGYNLLKKHGLSPEILCVLNSSNSGFPVEIYKYFIEMGASAITFLPLVLRDENNSVSPLSVVPEHFGEFLCTVFDEWVSRDIGRVKVQIFEEATRVAFNQDHTLCVFKKECGGVPVIDSNGDFYSCDHYVDNEHLLGNITDISLAGFLDSDTQKNFGMLKSLQLPVYCRNCTVKDMCNGECPRNRFFKSPDGEEGLNYLCRGYKMFFTHCQPFVNAVRELWLNGE